MKAREARSIAERWVAEEVARSPGEVLCVFTSGSINGMADDDPFPPSSDLDLVVVVSKVDPARHQVWKRPYGGIAIEVLYLPRERLLSAEALLAASSHCRRALDEACRWLRTPFFGDNCLTVHSRPALDLDVPACVAEGTGREIFLWVASVYAHVMIAIQNDAPADVAAAARRSTSGTWR
jgi:hypothetical protein